MAEALFRRPLEIHEVPLPEGAHFTHAILDPAFREKQLAEFEQFKRTSLENRLMLFERAKRDADFRAIVLERCRRDPAFFINHLVSTYDDRSGDGVVPFILYPMQQSKIVEPYTRLIACDFPDRITQGVAKSRATGYTWVSLALRLWAFLFIKNWSILIGSENRDDVDDGGQSATQQSLFGKIRFMIENLPSWARDELLGPMIKKDENNKRHLLVNPRHRRNIISGKQLSGMFGRSRRFSEVWADEVAWAEEMEDADIALKQTTNRFSFGSTPKGKEGFFPQMMFGPLKVERYWIWWPEMPHLDLDWYNAQRESMTDDAIAQELDISFERSAGGRVLHEYDNTKRFVEHADFEPRLPLTCILDPGFADHFAAIWGQWDEMGQQGRIVDFVQTNRVTVDWIVPFILGEVPLTTYRGDPWPHTYNDAEMEIIRRHKEWGPVEFVLGDKAGGAKNMVTATSPWEELERYGIYVDEITIDSNDVSIRHMNLIMRHIWCAKRLVDQRNGPKDQSPTLAEVTSQWRYKKKRTATTTGRNAIVHDIYSHGGDCIKMWCATLELPEGTVMPASSGDTIKEQAQQFEHTPDDLETGGIWR